MERAGKVFLGLVAIVGTIFAFLALVDPGRLCTVAKNFSVDIFCPLPPPSNLPIYWEDFEDGQFPTDWLVSGPWAFVKDGDNTALKSQSSSSAVEIGSDKWIDYSLEFKIKVTDVLLTQRAFFQLRNLGDRRLTVSVDFGQDQLRLFETKTAGGLPIEVPPSIDYPLSSDVWTKVELKVEGNRLAVLINDSPKRTIYFDSSISRGGIRFFTFDSTVLFDDINIDVQLWQS